MDSGQLDFYQHTTLCSNTCRSTKFDLLINNTLFPPDSGGLSSTSSQGESVSKGHSFVHLDDFREQKSPNPKLHFFPDLGKKVNCDFDDNLNTLSCVALAAPQSFANGKIVGGDLTERPSEKEDRILASAESGNKDSPEISGSATLLYVLSFHDTKRISGAGCMRPLSAFR